MAKSAKKPVKKAGSKRDPQQDAVEKDDRFKEVGFNAKFSRKSKEKSKIKVDKRFEHMFEDEDFAVAGTAKMDKFGRKVSKKDRKVGTELKRLYKIEDEESGAEEEETPKKTSVNKTEQSKEERREYLDKLARGEIELSSDEESEDESEDEQVESEAEEEIIEQEQEIPSGDATRRVAIQNLDWSRLSARDIFAVVRSFLPLDGKIVSVTVHQSEYGEKKMKEEEELGPQFDGEDDDDVTKESMFAGNDGYLDDEVAGEGSNFNEIKLRKYELQKLKYYFAVVVFDSVQTADIVYKNCDGVEFERSSIVFDLRFIPDELEIERPIRDQALSVSEDYQPPEFYSKALQSSKVELTWDEDDYSRQRVFQKWSQKGGKGARVIGDKDLEAFIASDGEDSGSDNDDDDDHKRKSTDYREKLRAALLSSDKQGSSDEEEEEEEEDKEEEMSEEEKEEEKRPKKAKEARKERAPHKPEKDLFNDPFFVNTNQSSKKSRKRDEARQQKLLEAEKEETEDDRLKKEQAELELLLLNENTRAKGKGLESFDFKAIAEGEKLLRKKKIRVRGKKKERVNEVIKAAKEDTFQVDTKDERFSSLFNDPEFSVDRTSSQYKDTRGMLDVEREQLRQRGEKKERNRGKPRGGDKRKQGDARDVDSMVESVKRKSSLMKANKHKKKKHKTQQ
uniref:NUC153 domain-containing protein n=1 Tax=Mucochytrium quahogii TaxID=96639 RepID=A0A7S2RA69_9STRA|mmetsp:Transcript_39083/g.63127  ORF Transcript_39083/g.63127 Transcript_39083/m.63127 type:complete len:677 (+) Transcript_39083:354-2384(+)|eukprot:CAMPEP_0203757898 /NCGR_PEP_ID=MMETSP0098-20131031/10746_1 /ASSEMBLY_ACC=CAM_ASM_000208 /TAXON_ID=96639 /ORGANISM=" , Strain NY0313808BC1" /LENGTH=676 /DNA_ID=CAMNT_0050650143 /DNA_START=157 /DNA_END=2184 /DNA_ORIENTATION=+